MVASCRGLPVTRSRVVPAAVRSLFLTGLGTLLWIGSSWGQTAVDRVEPEPATGRSGSTAVVTTDSFMVAAANPYAVEAGYEILKAGGSGIDALVTVQLVLNLVEPQSSGIGGGAFLVYFNNEDHSIQTYDGRETAPLEVDESLFLDEDGDPLAFFDAVVGGRSVGVPGTLKLLEQVHDRYGRLPWAQVLQPAIRLAEEGFRVSPRLAQLVADDQERLSRYPSTREYFFDGEGNPIQAGDRLRNPEFAETLSQIAEAGSEAFYRGEIAAAIVATVRGVDDNPGLLSLSDLETYRVIERDPVCVLYRIHKVCGMGPPSSGGVAVGQILGILNLFDLASLGSEDPRSWFLIGEASRLAFADRGMYLADEDFVPVPLEGLLDPQYLWERADLIDLGGTAMPTVEAGELPGDEVGIWRQGRNWDLPSTSHISIVDGEGNGISLTGSIENAFGSRLMVGGFLLNNQLTDFSFSPDREGRFVANRVQPGKRPLSSMAPTIVLEGDELRMVIGSPGGSRIIGYVVKTLISHLDWGLDIQTAIDLPHRVNRFGTYDLEEGRTTEGLASDLKALGYEVNIQDLTSGLHGIVITPEGQLQGGADPRREGVVKGE